MQSTGDIAAFRIGRCVPNKLKEREALPSNLRLQEPSYLGNEQQMYGAYHVAEALYLALRKESRTFEFAFFKQPDTTPKSNTIH